jgi:hypothetical protein
MPSYLRRLQQVEDHINALAGYRQPSIPANPIPPSQRPGGEAHERLCAFCNIPMKGERCRECGAPMPGEKEKKRC